MNGLKLGLWGVKGDADQFELIDRTRMSILNATAESACVLKGVTVGLNGIKLPIWLM